MDYVILGAGPAGVNAAESLRRLDSDASIRIIGDEPEPPYSRMAIPYLLMDRIDEKALIYANERHISMPAASMSCRDG